MTAEIKYQEAHDLHYKKKNFPEALKLYAQIIVEFPDSQEATYSDTQIQNIVISMGYINDEYQKLVDDTIEKFETKLKAEKEKIEQEKIRQKQAKQEARQKCLEELELASNKVLHFLEQNLTTQFEYCQCTDSGGFISVDGTDIYTTKYDLFNLLGKWGWELTTVTAGDGDPLYIFKRKKSDNQDINLAEKEFFQILSQVSYLKLEHKLNKTG